MMTRSPIFVAVRRMPETEDFQGGGCRVMSWARWDVRR